ncbi:MAG: glutaminyl-peptide cyclotransferase, partial [Ferruginibacter sp.]
MLFKLKLSTIIILLFFILSCNENKKNGASQMEGRLTVNNNSSLSAEESYVLNNVYPHDTNSFTQGLFVDNGIVYESTGSP